MGEWIVKFYEDENGQEPVKDFIVMQPYKARAEIIHVFDMLYQINIQLPYPYTSKVEDDLWELRIKHSSDYYRILYSTVPEKTFLLLHGILKKTDDLPKQDIALARRRLKRYKSM
jgi:phage-related protein